MTNVTPVAENSNQDGNTNQDRDDLITVFRTIEDLMKLKLFREEKCREDVRVRSVFHLLDHASIALWWEIKNPHFNRRISNP